MRPTNRPPHPHLPRKLQDCSADAADRELFIVEGDSAARAVAAARSPSFQAVLPMQGKPLNPLKASRSDVLQHPKYADVLAALGIDTAEKATDESIEFQRDQLRYQKIVLLFDPDADGIHARSLMHLFFDRWLRSLLEGGHIFDTHAPLWEITHDALERPLYASTKAHLDRVRQQLTSQGISPAAQRFRGLASVPAATLRQRCLDPRTRRLTPVSAADAQLACEFSHKCDSFELVPRHLSFERLTELRRGSADKSIHRVAEFIVRYQLLDSRFPSDCVRRTISIRWES